MTDGRWKYPVSQLSGGRTAEMIVNGHAMEKALYSETDAEAARHDE